MKRKLLEIEMKKNSTLNEKRNLLKIKKIHLMQKNLTNKILVLYNK